MLGLFSAHESPDPPVQVAKVRPYAGPVQVIMLPAPRPIGMCNAKWLRKKVPHLYDDDAESGNGESDFCVRCHEAR